RNLPELIDEDMKIMTSNVAAGKRLSCVLNASLSSKPDTLEARRGNSNSSSRTETHSARLSSTLKRHTLHARQREVLGHAKEMAAKVFPIHMTISSDSARTARKTIRTATDHLTKDSPCKTVIDPDLGHCDIVFIDKPITECFKKRHRSMTPRRNARKSTRGHMYSDEIWELKTVRTLAGRGNCPNPMPELITLVTPKQIFSRPESVPPLDIPFVGTCRETANQEMTMEQSVESAIPVTEDIVEVAASQVDVLVKTSQTSQCQSKGQTGPPSPFQSPAKNMESATDIDVAQESTADSGTTQTNEENVSQTPVEAEKDTESEAQGETDDSTEQKVAQTIEEPFNNKSMEETEPQPPSDELHIGESALQQTSSSSPVTQIEGEHDNREELKDALPQECQPERDVHCDDLKLTEKVNTTGSDGNVIVEESEKEFSKVDSAEDQDDDDDDHDVSSKTLNALLKELPPWRRKKGTKILLPKHMRQTQTTIVGYVNGRPINASDRSLRRRAGNTRPPSKTPVKSSDATKIGHLVTESSPSEKPTPSPHTPSKSVEPAPLIEKLAEPLINTSSPISKSPVRTKQTQKQKQPQRTQGSPVLSDPPADSSSNTESKRQLRSARQKLNGTPLPTSNAITPVAIPEATVTPSVSPTEQAPSPLPSHAHSISMSPLVRLTVPPHPEQLRQDTVPETVEENTENTQQEEATDETHKSIQESRLETKQKLRSAKSTDDNSKNEKQQLGEVSSPLINKSPVKAEMQVQLMPLRSKRFLRKESEASDVALLPKPNVESLEDRGASGDESSSSMSDKPTRMPLRSENNKAEASHQSFPQSPQAKNKKSALRSHQLASPSTSSPTPAGEQNDVSSPVRIMPARGSKAQVKSPSASAPHSSHTHIGSSKHDPSKPTTNKFYQTMTGEESQHLITNLNIRYDKMQKGWVQMDKEGQPATKYRNKADRQAAIWKSKRRTRKPKSSEHQKYSPVQMLFMKGFNLTSICRWFLESTETKSLVIVKKVNTRLPSETQLCFHSSSSASGTSQGVFPSLQAERLKKHLKKFAIASPVKSNPKSQKLIAKVLEQEANVVKGKERGELPSTTQTLNKSYSSAKACAQKNEPKKSSGKSKNPASARILRKYSNIREKMQVQQTTVRLKEASKIIKTKSIKTLDTPKSPKKSNVKPSLKAPKSPLTVSKQTKEAAAKLEKRKTLAAKKSPKLAAQEKAVKASSSSSRPSKDVTKKEVPKRSSQRLGCTKVSGNVPSEPSKSKAEKKHTETEKPQVEKNAVNKVNSAKTQTKESSHITAAELKGTEKAAETPKQSSEVKVPTSPDQVLTRSQRKMEAAAPASESPSNALKRATKSTTVQNATSKSAKKTDEPAQTRSVAKRSQAVSLPRSASKLANKRAQELLETPAKRTRTSLSR
uniref:Uncharacterized protein n=1 Tax=Salarias fasciatus TaxID=181472 RepID=A0A672IJY9_SALFA